MNYKITSRCLGTPYAEHCVYSELEKAVSNQNIHKNTLCVSKEIQTQQVHFRLCTEYPCTLLLCTGLIQWNTTVNCSTYRLTPLQYNCPLLLRTGLLQCSITVHCCYVQAYSIAVQLSTVVTYRLTAVQYNCPLLLRKGLL